MSEELDQLRQIIRGQVHAINNVLATLGFAAALAPNPHRERLRDLSNELGSQLRRMRLAAAPPSEPPSLQTLLEDVAVLVGNLPDGPPRVTVAGEGAADVEAPGGDRTLPLVQLLISRLRRSDADVTLECLPQADGRHRLRLHTPQPPALSPCELRFARAAMVEATADAEHLDLELGAGASSSVAVPRPVPVRRLLIVEDDLTLSGFLAAGLQSSELEVALAATAEEARGLHGERAFDAILVDFRLGSLDGLSLASELRDITPCQILIMSGDARPEGRSEDLGDSAWLEKPFTIKALLEQLGH